MFPKSSAEAISGRPYDPNANTDTPDYYGTAGGTVTVYCENELGQKTTTDFTW